MKKLTKKNCIEELSNAIFDADRNLANDIIDRWAINHTYESAIIEILEPALFSMGVSWNKKELAIAQ
jgi:hypothetical protein